MEKALSLPGRGKEGELKIVTTLPISGTVEREAKDQP
jgi:hypothetical protein